MLGSGKYFVLISCQLLCLSFFAHGYIQKVTFHEKEDESGNYFVFLNEVPDIHAHTSLENCERYCFHGGWYTYTGVNYTGSAWYHTHTTKACYNMPDLAGGQFPGQSFRHYGTSDTNVDALTLFYNLFEDNNRIVTNPAAGDLDMPSWTIIGQTGQSPWTLFEGTDFDGHHVCIPGTGKNGTALHSLVWDFDLEGIGSVVKGCFSTQEELTQLKVSLKNQGLVK